MLNIISHGTDLPGTPPLIIAHGLFGSARNWGALARRFGETLHVLAVDMRNHGYSAHSDRHDYPALADDLAKVIAAHGGQAYLLGHSMGGKAAMWLALTAPGAVRRLVVADIAPVGYEHSQMPVIEALRALDLAAITSRRDADTALARDIEDPGVRGFLLQSLDLSTRPPGWKLNLAALAANMDKLTGFPETDARWDGPALFLAGADSSYVDARGEAAIARHFPAARIARIANAGHWLHAERPDAVAEAIMRFLAEG
ncbi:MAG: alpha/beta fold hydrolase [Rhodobacteraceae bacterium]|nr:alpha/beta fold hydrolase [Paracoccaceae bacterium]